MQKVKRAMQLDKKKWFNDHECNNIMWSHATLGQNPVVLNYTMFLLTIQNMCNDEQRAKWEPLCKNMNVMGTYAQTEIGHGSNVAGIQTTATYDRKTDEVVINTPTITATKWWPGDLGNFSSHGMVFCRLKIDSQDYGVMPFMV
jgi:acyl-CoA oxidase